MSVGTGRAAPRADSELPGNRTRGVRLVDAEVARLDAGREVVAEGQVALADPRERILDALGDCEARPLGRGGCLPVPAPEANGGRELLGEELDLLAGPGRSSRVVEPVGLLPLLAEILEPTPVRGLRLRVEHRAGVAEAGHRHFPDQLDHRARSRRAA